MAIQPNDSRTADLFARVKFDPPRARTTDPGTSYAAAERASFKASEGRIAALRALHDFGPLTDFELADRTGRQQTSIGKRRLECQTAGLVKATYCAETGKPYTRATPSGAQAIVWRLTDAGLAFVAGLK